MEGSNVRRACVPSLLPLKIKFVHSFHSTSSWQALSMKMWTVGIPRFNVVEFTQTRVFMYTLLISKPGHYYKMAGPKELEMFLEDPDKYVPPNAPRPLPPPENLPHRATKEDLEGKEAEILGYCPVTYLDGNLR